MVETVKFFPSFFEPLMRAETKYVHRVSAKGLNGKNVLSYSEMIEIEHQWDQLDSEKLEDNIYYTRRYVSALLDNLPQKNEVLFIASWHNEKLSGLMPIVKKRAALPYLIPGGRAWATPYTFSCLPILNKKSPVQAAKGLLRALAETGVSDWYFPDFYLSGPTCDAFCHALEGEKIAWRSVQKYDRALFEKGPKYEQHLAEYVPKKRRRDLARNLRKLEKLGIVSHEVQTQGPGLAKAVDAFLALEESGWKGKRGTALACNPDTQQFAKDIFSSSIKGQARCDLLLLDGEPIAAGMIVFDGDTGFTVKGAYDEAYHNCSVGLLLELKVAESFLDGDWIEKLDSATAGSHVIDFLWPERQSVGDLYFSFRRGATTTKLENFEKVDRFKSLCKTKIKKIIGR